MTRPGDLSWDEATALAAVDREQLVARLREDAAKPRHQMRLIHDRSVWTRRWVWSVENDVSGEVLIAGRAWSRRGAERRRERAYLRVTDGAS